jgi:NDP-sugar pyrophosphorylase family protein
MAQHKIACVIPMTGQGVRFSSVGYKDPKPLIPVSGQPIIERLLSNLNPSWDYYFILAENHRSTGLVECLKKAAPHCKIQIVPHEKKGPSWALMSVIDDIPSDQPVFVSYCDYGMIWDVQQFERFVRQSDCDACLVSYRGFHAHYLTPTNYAFSRMVGERVVEVREKGNFTDNRENEYASCGAYYFRTAEILKASIDSQIRRDMSMNGEFYTSLTIQALLLDRPDAHVRVFEIPGFFQWGTPLDLVTFEYWEKSYHAWNRYLGKTRPTVDQILMPMAGFGSRFAQISKVPKPLISLGGLSMYQQALQTLPKSESTAIVTRQEILSSIPKTVQVLGLDQVPPGQALTTEKGLSLLKDQGDILVSACDHGVALNPEVWSSFRKDPKCVAAIFTIRGFPGVYRSPLSYSYVEVQPGTDQVLRVSVKKPVTERAEKDHLLVGTFWFQNKKILEDGIQKLKLKGQTVNNELYLDAVFNEFIQQGQPVRVIELDGYFNWGDPDSLKESLYWQEIFMGRQFQKRETYPGVDFSPSTKPQE